MSTPAKMLSVLIGASLLGLGAAGGLADEPKKKQPPAATDDSWVYRSREHGFTLRLPSKRWVEIGKGKGVAAFHCPFPFPMTAAVQSVRKESPEQYRETVKKFKDYVKKNEAILVGKPEFADEETAAGDLRCFFLAREKGKAGDEYIQLGMSYTWLKDRGVTVQILFEGNGKMKSRLFQAKEKAAFEEAAKAVCLSVGAAGR